MLCDDCAHQDTARGHHQPIQHVLLVVPAQTPSADPEDDVSRPGVTETSGEEDPSTRVAADHVFAIGDVADAFGAVNAGHNAFFQGEVAARNILKLVRRREGVATAEDMKLEKYSPGPPAIKVSLGLVSPFDGGIVGSRNIDVCVCRTRACTSSRA